MDQINYAFALLEDGEATGDHWQSVSTVTKYLKRHPHITGVLSVGGWGAEGFSDATATAQGREKLAQSMLELMDQHGFRGIDLDWEYPGSSMGGLKHRENDWDNYLSLMELLRVELDAREAATGKDYILSVALGANKSLINAVDGTRLSSLVDQVNLMTYDFTGFDRTTGHHAALYPDEQVLLFMILPIKMKYLALVDAALYLYYFIVGTASTRITIVLCLLNVALFLGGDIINTIRRESRYWKTRYNFRKAMRK